MESQTNIYVTEVVINGILFEGPRIEATSIEDARAKTPKGVRLLGRLV